MFKIKIISCNFSLKCMSYYLKYSHLDKLCNYFQFRHCNNNNFNDIEFDINFIDLIHYIFLFNKLFFRIIIFIILIYFHKYLIFYIIPYFKNEKFYYIFNFK